MKQHARVYGDSDAARIRLARIADSGAIARMSRDLIEYGLAWRYTPEAIQRAVRDAETDVVLAHSGKQLTGFAVMQYDFRARRSHLVLLAVDPLARRTGVGTALVAWLEAIARTGGIRELALETRAENLDARTFYRRLGFVERERVCGYYEGREDAIRLVREL